MKLDKILFALLLILGVTYFVIDRHLSYYGKSDFDVYNLLPLKVNPEYRNEFEGGFTLWDAYGFSLVGKGVKFRNSDIEVNEVVKYGFDDERLVVLVEGVGGSRYFVGFKKNEDAQSKQDLDVNIWDTGKSFSSDDYKWIQIQNNDKLIRTMELLRNYVMFVAIALFLFLIFRFWRVRNLRANT